MSKTRNKIWEVKRELPVLGKDSQGFKFKYTDLLQLEKALLPILEKHNLAFFHKTVNDADGNNILYTTVFSLEDDELFGTETSSLVIPDGITLAGMNGYQSLGSALTYFRRYNLLTMFDIITDDDVDGIVPPKKKPKVDYVRKVQENIAKGVTKSQLEAWFGKNRGLMQPEVRDEVYEVIQAMR